VRCADEVGPLGQICQAAGVGVEFVRGYGNRCRTHAQDDGRLSQPVPPVLHERELAGPPPSPRAGNLPVCS
jgi:hypothetical protein